MPRHIDHQERADVKREVQEDRFSCNFCSEVFTEIADLRKHEMEHTGNDVVKVSKVKQNIVENTGNVGRNQNSDTMGSSGYVTKTFRVNDNAVNKMEKMGKVPIKVFKGNCKTDEMDHTRNDAIKVFKRSSNDNIGIQTFSGEKRQHVGEKQESKGHRKKSRNKRTVLMPKKVLPYSLADLHTDSDVDSHVDDNQCSLCDKFTCRYRKLHAVEKPFHCSFCDQSFTLRDDLISHEQNHSNDIHKRSHNNDTQNHTDDIHKQSHSNDTQNNTDDIHKRSHSNDTWNHSDDIHKQSHSNDTQNHSDDIHKRSHSNDTRNHSDDIHKRSHSKDTPFACEVCGNIFVQKLAYRNHLKTHTGEWPFTCKECEKGFSTLSSLKMHESRHEGGLPYQCDICKKGFHTTSVLMHHKVVAHIQESSCHSSMPDVNFGSNSSVQSHDQNYINEGFYCRKCKQIFPTRSKLMEHQISHQDRKNYQCKKCGEEFETKGSLMRHHTLHCHVVAAARHQALHSHYTLPNVIKPPTSNQPPVDKTFQCDKCDERFWRKRHLTRHKTFNCKYTRY